MKPNKSKLAEHKAQQALDVRRKSIDAIDRKVMRLLAERFRHVTAVGKIKKSAGLPVVNKKREGEVVRKLLSYSRLSQKFVKDFYRLILREAYQLEKTDNA